MKMAKKEEYEYRAQGIYKQVAPEKEQLFKDRLLANRATKHTLLLAPKKIRKIKLR